MIPLSKTMRMSDFDELATELATVDQILRMLNGGDKAQHTLRRWEYAMGLRAYMQWAGRTPKRTEIVKLSDHGCCTGMFGPMMFWLGCNVSLYEVWAWGNQEEFATKQIEMLRRPNMKGSYRWIHRPLGQLEEEDNGVDAAFCISTMEHIPDFEVAFRQMAKTVNPGGMLFMTSDSAKDEHDHYIANNVRAGTMFNAGIYEKIAGWGREYGFELIGGTSDWSWDESCQLIPKPNTPGGYGFACLAMEKAE
jgi:ubiquinone/menaquinone biosynthesis C-methylase UbiE